MALEYYEKERSFSVKKYWIPVIRFREHKFHENDPGEAELHTAGRNPLFPKVSQNPLRNTLDTHGKYFFWRSNFSKNWQFSTLILGYFLSLKSTNPYK
ncbi:MAG TPA: hypothetical protein DCK79_07715 [Candidatus Atribacteria bacterium]|nr:hypothetical protein [Candidatus Atribacteria bacterium]